MPTLSMLKIRTAVVVAALSVVFLPPVLHAQRNNSRSQMKVPFGFQVGTVHFAPGQYVLDESNDHILLVQGANRAAMTMSDPELVVKSTTRSKVIFHRYGNLYFLREVWTGGSDVYITCPESKAEREARRAERAPERASVDTRANVEIALLDGPR
jgi:hypothetical protein